MDAVISGFWIFSVPYDEMKQCWANSEFIRKKKAFDTSSRIGCGSWIGMIFAIPIFLIFNKWIGLSVACLAGIMIFKTKRDSKFASKEMNRIERSNISELDHIS